MSTTRVVAAIGLGSNLGDRERTLARALVLLERTSGVTVLRRSRWIETAPEGGPLGAGHFLNGAVLVETTLAPRELLDALLAIERRLGRERGVPNAPRTIDLDLLDHGGIRLDEPGLRLPHPRMEERLFVLEPLSEIAPAMRLAGSGKSVRERVAELRARPSEPRERSRSGSGSGGPS